MAYELWIQLLNLLKTFTQWIARWSGLPLPQLIASLWEVLLNSKNCLMLICKQFNSWLKSFYRNALIFLVPVLDTSLNFFFVFYSSLLYKKWKALIHLGGSAQERNTIRLLPFVLFIFIQNARRNTFPIYSQFLFLWSQSTTFNSTRPFTTEIWSVQSTLLDDYAIYSWC